jgi:hypothetical protein
MEIDNLGYLFKAGYSDPTTLDKNKRAALKRDKAYTRATLLQSVDESFLEIIRTGDDGESPGPAWWALKRHFVGSSAYDLRSVLTQLLTHKQGEDSLTSYIDKMNIFCTRLAAGNKPVSDETKLVYFLAGLHPRYANFKDVLEAPGQAALTYQDACAAVVAHHRRKFGDPSVALGQSVAMLATGGQDSRTCGGAHRTTKCRNHLECMYCKKRGHLESKCRNKARDATRNAGQANAAYNNNESKTTLPEQGTIHYGWMVTTSKQSPTREVRFLPTVEFNDGQIGKLSKRGEQTITNTTMEETKAEAKEQNQDSCYSATPPMLAWISDSGCTTHLVTSPEGVLNYQTCDTVEEIKTASEKAKSMRVIGTGEVKPFGRVKVVPTPMWTTRHR